MWSEIFKFLPIVVLFLIGTFLSIDLDEDKLANWREIQLQTTLDEADTDNDGLNDYEEVTIYKTNPRSPDTDNDGLADKEEIEKYGTSPTLPDSDGDGLEDGDEILVYKTNPKVEDTDGDGLEDGKEVEGWFITVDGTTFRVTSDPKIKDTDSDGLADYQELELKTNPQNDDTDDDGLSDKLEVDGWDIRVIKRIQEMVIHVSSEPAKSDTDNDGLDDFEERKLDGNPQYADTDEDGLNDLDEKTYGTLLADWDTDDELLSDGEEIEGFAITVDGTTIFVSSNPLLPDTDDDGLDDREEKLRGLNPSSWDTDYDRLSDKEEIELYLTDPTISDMDDDGLKDGDEILTYNTNVTYWDTDKDGLSDSLEVKILSKYGANPLHRDIFVEVDRMESAWSLDAIFSLDRLIKAFKNAPIKNPDGNEGVDLHLFFDNTIPDEVLEPPYYPQFYELKKKYSDLPDGFRWALLVNSVKEPSILQDIFGDIGGFTFEGDKGFVVDTTPLEWGAWGLDIGSAQTIFMHELGHNLGLLPRIYEGIDAYKWPWDYDSVMNYALVSINPFKLDYSRGGDFNDWEYLEKEGFMGYWEEKY